MYVVSTLAALGVAWVLTRAGDYNAPSDINSTGAIPVVNGTANALTSWLLTSTVNTVGTDALTYAEFSLNPTTVVVGPASSTSTNIPQFSGTSGKLLSTGLTFSTDGTLAANSDSVVVSQKAIVTYVAANSGVSIPIGGTLIGGPGCTPAAGNFIANNGSQYTRSSYTGLSGMQDAYNWTKRTSATTYANTNTSRVVWGATPAIFIQVGTGIGAAANTTAQSSGDGVTWAARTMPSSKQWRDCCYIGGSVNKFVAIADDAANTAAADSSNGTSWSATGAMTASRQWNGIAASTTAAVAVCYDDGVTNYTTNGTSWNAGGTLAGATATTPRSVFWSPAAGLFIAVESLLATYWTSPTGVTWTARTFPNSMAVLPDTGTLGNPIISTSTMTFALMTSNYQVYSTTDAINWTAIIIAPTQAGGVVSGWDATASAVFTCDGMSLYTSFDNCVTWCKRNVAGLVGKNSRPDSFFVADNGSGTFVITADQVNPARTTVIGTFIKDSTKLQSSLSFTGQAEYVRYV